jgi:hypothetical protein
MPRLLCQSASVQIFIDQMRGHAPMPAQEIQVLFAGGRKMSIWLSTTTKMDLLLAAMVQVIRAAPAPGMCLEMDLAMESSENLAFRSHLCGARQR